MSPPLKNRGFRMDTNYYEATSTFTLVTTRIVAHPASRGFVDGLQKVTFPSPPAIQATGLPAVTLTGLSPASACGPSLGTLKVKDLTPVFPPIPNKEQQADALFQIISKRSETATTIVTTNLIPSQWGKIFDTTTASAILDRSSLNGRFITLEGRSYRSRKQTS